MCVTGSDKTYHQWLFTVKVKFISFLCVLERLIELILCVFANELFPLCLIMFFTFDIQKGSGAILNTVKTRANPAMKTVYKFVCIHV